jgi:hypothetical protein
MSVSKKSRSRHFVHFISQGDITNLLGNSHATAGAAGLCPLMKKMNTERFAPAVFFGSNARNAPKSSASKIFVGANCHTIGLAHIRCLEVKAVLRNFSASVNWIQSRGEPIARFAGRTTPLNQNPSHEKNRSKPVVHCRCV